MIFHILEHYAPLGKDQKALYILIWKYLQDILLSEKSKVQKNLYFIVLFVKNSDGRK